jgi:hypothetical protein
MLKNIKNEFMGYLKKIRNPYSYYSIIVIYIFIIIFQIFYIKQKTNKSSISKLDKDIEFNNKNYEELTIYLKEKLKERVYLLTSGKMSYKDWLTYNSKNHGVTYKGHTYDFFVCERGEFKKAGDSLDVFKIAANQNEKYVNVTWKDIYTDANEQFVFVKQTLDPSTLLRFFEFGKEGINKITYYWVDYTEGNMTPIVEDSYYIIIPATKENNEALISISIDMLSLKKENTFYYIDHIYIQHIAILSFFTFIISVLLNVSSKNSQKIISYIFLIITNFYLVFFLTSTEYYGSNETEIKKIKQINSGILSVSFLVGVNTFIITHLIKNSYNDLFIQSASIFSISLILLLFVALKTTDYITVNQMLKNRLTNQIFFNFSLVLNIFVVINYIFSVIK